MDRSCHRPAALSWIAALLLISVACAPSAPAPTTAPTKPAEPPKAGAEAKPAETKPAAPGGPAEAKPAAKPAPSWQMPAGNLSISLWDTTEAPKATLYKEVLIPEYQKLRPNVTVNYENISATEYFQKLTAALSTGTGPDLFVQTDWFMPTYVAKGLVDPVPPEAFDHPSLQAMVDAYIPGRLDMFLKDGKLWAIPYQMNAHSFFLNNRLFQEAGLDPVKDAPRTWDDVARLNQKLLKKDGDRVIQKGYDARLHAEFWISMMFHFLLYQNGGTMLKDGKPAFNDEAGVKAMQVWKKISSAPKVSKNSGASPFQDFADEQDAMTNMPPNAGAVIELLNPKLKGGYTVVPFPQTNPDKPVNMMYSFNLVVNAKAPDDRKKAAWDFISFATASQGKPQLWMERTRMVNPLKGWYETPEAKKVPFVDIFVRDMSLGIPMARTEFFGELQSSLARAVERIVLQDADTKQSLDQAAEEYERATKK